MNDLGNVLFPHGSFPLAFHARIDMVVLDKRITNFILSDRDASVFVEEVDESCQMNAEEDEADDDYEREQMQ